MVLYTCQRCGYENKIKSHFIKHLNRKKPCDITLLAVDRRVPNIKSYIEKKKDGKIIDITKIDFGLEQKFEENPDFSPFGIFSSFVGFRRCMIFVSRMRINPRLSETKRSGKQFSISRNFHLNK